jgi:adenine-specific DNA-methyltransferase
MMRDRLLQLKKLLAPDGSIWVHCDDYEQHRLRSVMDEVFGPRNFKATVIWQKLYARKSNTDFSTSHDYILVYAKEPASFRRNLQSASAEQLKRYKNPDNDPRGPWQSVSFHVRTDDPAKRTEYRYEIALPSGRVVGPPRGRHWNGKRPRYERLLEENRLWFGADGDSLPRFKDFLKPEEVGLVPTTWWPRDEVGDNDESKGEIQALFSEIRDPFQTPKPERLMERIIHIASNPGDVVLDCFAGSGTTAAVAQKMGRRFVAVEWSRETIETFTGPRLEQVVAGEDPGGITESAGWEGGGGFRVLDVAPSMFDEDAGQVVLAEWALGTALAEATAAQLGFAYDPETLPFCGRKGRTRLAVVDGLVNEGVVRLLVAELSDDERLTVCGTMVDPAARDVLSDLRPGSSLRKVPESILADYRLGHLWWDGNVRQEALPGLDALPSENVSD